MELHAANQSRCITLRGIPLKTLEQKAQRDFLWYDNLIINSFSIDVIKNVFFCVNHLLYKIINSFHS